MGAGRGKWGLDNLEPMSAEVAANKAVLLMVLSVVVGCEKSYCNDCQDERLEFCIVCNEHYCSDNNCHDHMH
eukprot:scaffold27741_cov50-Skeletonema_dohrnii-CCMP3373.AAC.1